MLQALSKRNDPPYFRGSLRRFWQLELRVLLFSNKIQRRRKCRQLFIGFFFFIESFAEQVNCILEFQQLGVSGESSVGGNFVVLYFLGRTDQRRVERSTRLFLFNQIRPLL